MSRILNVLLVDDEYLAIEDLSSMIDWSENGFRIVAASRSGRQALKALSEHPVDLVVTDISMPGMDGITLIEEARKLYPRLVFLLLTAYAEVDYMKRAFRQDVEDYLIKDEISAGILTEKLQKIRTKILSHDEEAYSHLQKRFREYFNDSEAAMPASLSAYQGRRCHYCVVTPDILYPNTGMTLYDRVVTSLSMIQSALPYIEEFRFAPARQLCSFLAFNQKIVILLELPAGLSMQQTLELLTRYASSLLRLLTDTLPYSFSFFYRQIALPVEKIHRDYFSMQAPLRGRYFLKRKTILPMESDLLFVTNKACDLTTEALLQAFRESPVSLTDMVKQQLRPVRASHNYAGLFGLLDVCFSFLSRVSGSAVFSCAYENCRDLDSLSAFLFLQFERLQTEVKQTLSREVRQAADYIAGNFQKPELSLQEIADHIGLSVTHLSRIFKSETGDTVGDYITACRIRKACRLLTETNLKIYEISEAAGYSSPQYFSQVFVKQIGVKPLDYRKKNQTS
ncbi:MAG: response regulator [Lachnospiraceae bacterium]|nr:response regulator [Lachnospiraceae bacterium]